MGIKTLDKLIKKKNRLTDTKAAGHNQGFTLIELLLSISILAIIIGPLLNSFVTAARANAKAEKMQSETILAQNLLEDIKARPMAHIAGLFDYPEDFSDSYAGSYEVIPEDETYRKAGDTEKSCIKTVVLDENGAVSYQYKLVEKKSSPYYYAISGIKQGQNSYDVLISLDPTAYITTNELGAAAGYNAYPMPLISEINTEKNVTAIQSKEEETALSDLYLNHAAYNARLKEQHKEENPPFQVTYYNKEDIKQSLNKKINITITRDNEGDVATVDFEYSAPGIPGAETVSYRVVQKSLKAPDGTMYVFYYPSRKDSIGVSLQNESNLPMDIYLVKQDSDTICTSETVEGSIPAGIRLYSNANFSHLTRKLVKRDEGKNRIFRVKVKLYKAGSNFAEDELITELTSTKEE